MSGDVREVRLVGFPLRLYERAAEHHAELMREFQLLAIDPPAGQDVSRRLIGLIEELAQTYAGDAEVPSAAREAALLRGEESVDLTYRVPASAAGACQRLDAMLDEAEEFCRADRLLTLAAPEEVAALRRWYLGEFVAQIGGAPPTPWPEFATATRR